MADIVELHRCPWYAFHEDAVACYIHPLYPTSRPRPDPPRLQPALHPVQHMFIRFHNAFIQSNGLFEFHCLFFHYQYQQTHCFNTTAYSGKSHVASLSATAVVTTAINQWDTQGTMVAGCRRFYFVQPGDGCWQITNDASITGE